MTPIHSHFENLNNGQQIKFTSFVNCQTCNVIYTLACSCSKVYVGQRTQKWKKRIQQHISTTRLASRDLANSKTKTKSVELQVVDIDRITTLSQVFMGMVNFNPLLPCLLFHGLVFLFFHILCICIVGMFYNILHPYYTKLKYINFILLWWCFFHVFFVRLVDVCPTCSRIAKPLLYLFFTEQFLLL